MLTAAAIACVGRGLWNAGVNQVRYSRLVRNIVDKPLHPTSPDVGRSPWKTSQATPMHIVKHTLRQGENFRHIRLFEPLHIKHDDHTLSIGDIFTESRNVSQVEEKNPVDFVDAAIAPVNKVHFAIPASMPVFMNAKYLYTPICKHHTDTVHLMQIRHRINILSWQCYSGMICIEHGEMLRAGQPVFLYGSTTRDFSVSGVDDDQVVTKTTFRVQQAGTDLYKLAKNASKTRKVMSWIMAGGSFAAFAYFFNDWKVEVKMSE